MKRRLLLSLPRRMFSSNELMFKTPPSLIKWAEPFRPPGDLLPCSSMMLPGKPSPFGAPNQTSNLWRPLNSTNLKDANEEEAAAQPPTESNVLFDELMVRKEVIPSLRFFSEV
ncbi:hypothetical protein E2320_020364 [Naja naja]|nr:hypothetical protein E2320_020364 [Naja naja]